MCCCLQSHQDLFLVDAEAPFWCGLHISLHFRLHLVNSYFRDQTTMFCICVISSGSIINNNYTLMVSNRRFSTIDSQITVTMYEGCPKSIRTWVHISALAVTLRHPNFGVFRSSSFCINCFDDIAKSNIHNIRQFDDIKQIHFTFPILGYFF